MTHSWIQIFACIDISRELGHHLERLVEIRNDILDVFDANRDLSFHKLST